MGLEALPLAMCAIALELTSASRNLLRHHYPRLPHFRAGRIEDADGRADRRILVVVAGIVAVHGVDGLFMWTMLAGRCW